MTNWFKVVLKSSLIVAVVILVIIGFFNLHRINGWILIGFIIAIVVVIISIFIYEYDK